MIERVFMGWERPLIETAAAWIAQRFRTDDTGRGIDFQQTLVVVPGRRFGRELTAEIVGIGEKTDSWVSPGRVTTPGELCGVLVDSGTPMAPGLLRAMAWGEALRGLPVQLFEHVLRRRPDDASAAEWMRLGRMIDGSVGELARELLTPDDVAVRAGDVQESGESSRWRSIDAARPTYEQLLASARMADGHLFRLATIRSGGALQTGGLREIVLVGVVELDQASRRAIDRCGLPVHSLVFAPEAEASAVDEFGCVSRAPRGHVSIDSSCVEFAEDVRDGAKRIVGRIAAWTQPAGELSARDVTVCAPTPALAIELGIAATRVEGLAFHDAAGEKLGGASVVKLLAMIAEFLREQTVEALAALVKRPEIERWIESAAGPEPGWINRIDQDAIFAPDVPAREYDQRDGKVAAAVLELCAGLVAAPATQGTGLSQRLDAVVGLLDTVFGAQELNDREAGAIRAIADVIEECRNGSEWIPNIEGWRAIELLLEGVADARQPDSSTRSEVEVLGWLEAAADRAPYLAVLGLNEGMIPVGRVEDALLPESVRRVLGMPTGESRAERDAFLLEGAIRSREKRGGVWFVCAKRDEDGGPLKPSRLLFRCDDAEALARVERAVSEIPEPARFNATARTQTPDAKAGAAAFPLAPLHELPPPAEVHVTAFREYVRSPYVFFLKRIAKLEELDEPSPEADQSRMGKVLHKVLQGFGPEQSRALKNEDEIASWAMEQLAQTVNTLPRQRSSAVRDAQIEVARRRLRMFARLQSEHADAGWIVHSTERMHTEPVFLETPEGRLGLRGQIDRIDVRGDEWLVLDYKTADKPMPPEKTHRNADAWIDLQLPLYIHILRQMEPTASNARAGYILLPRASAEGKIVRGEWDDAMIDDAIRRAKEIAAAMLRKEYPLGDDPYGSGAIARLCGVTLVEADSSDDQGASEGADSEGEDE
ncbi:MAG: PD-(D/E)XK nuclease family protein [Planctomycetes bacterium]|nr:PD-(D/E)XK nuclease family protein [Planctomycetota bacterium]